MVVRLAEPGDAEALRHAFAGPRAVSRVHGLPYPSVGLRQERLPEQPEGVHSLMAGSEGMVLGGVEPRCLLKGSRRRGGGEIATAVRDDRQGIGAGTALMEVAL